MASPQDELVVEEFKSCRSLIEKNIDIMEKNEVYAVGAAGALFVFSLSSSSYYVAIASAWASLLIAIIGTLRFWGLDKTIDVTNDYLIQIESAQKVIGWAGFYKKRNAEKGKTLKQSRIALWIMFNIACIVFGFYMTLKAPVMQPTDGRTSAVLSTHPVKNSN